MSWKKVIIMLLLLSAAMGIPYYFYSAGYIDSWQQQFMADLENRLDLEIEYDEFNLLPVNRLSIGGLYVSGEEFSLEVSRLNIYYDFNRFLSNLYQERLEIQLLPAVLDSLEVLEAEGLRADVDMPEAEHLRIEELEDETRFDPLILWEYLPSLPRRAQVVIDDGSVSYTEAEGAVELTDLRVEAASPVRNRLELAAAGNVEIIGLELLGYDLESLSAEKTVVDAEFREDSWSLDTQLQLQPPSESIKSLLEQLETDFGDINFAGLSSQQLSASMSGSDGELAEMQIDSSGYLEQLSLEPDISRGEEFWPGADSFRRQELTISELDWDVSYDFAAENIYLPKLDFSLFQGDFAGSGYISTAAPREDFLFELQGEEFNLADIFAMVFAETELEERKEISSYQAGVGSLNLRAVPGSEGPTVELAAETAGSSLNGQDFATQLRAFWRDDMLRVEQAEVDLGLFSGMSEQAEDEEQVDEGKNRRQKLNLSGAVNTETLDYDFSIEGQNLSPDLLENSPVQDRLFSSVGAVERENLADYWPEAGSVNFALEGVGQDIDPESLQLWGEVDIEQVRLEGFPRGSLQSEFWFSDGRLDISLLTLETEPARLELTGVIDIYEEDLDLWLETNRMDLQELMRIDFVQSEELADEIRGETAFTGRIAGSFAAPDLSLTINVPRAEILGMEIDQGRGELGYNPGEEKFVLKELDFNSRDAGVVSSGSLAIAPDIQSSYLDLDLEIEGLTYEYINDLFDLELPLTGDVGGTVNISGPLEDIKVESRANSASTVFSPQFASEFELSFKNSRASFYWQEGEPFQVRDLYMERDHAVFKMDGDFADDYFSVDYGLKNYQLEHAAAVLPDLDYDIAGSAAITGEASGSYENPSARADLEVGDISLRDMLLGELTGEVELAQGELIIPGARWNPGSGRVEVSGRIGEIMSEQDPELNLSLQADNMELEHYLRAMEYELEIPVPYHFSGNVDIIGTAADPTARIDASLVGEEFGWGEINLSGEISDSYNLSLFGSGIQLSYMAEQLPADYADLQGGIQLEGDLSGPLESPRVELATQILDLTINGYSLREVTGRAVLDENLDLHLEQEFLAAAGGRLGLEADFSLQEEIEEGSFIFRAEEFPLAVVENFMPEEMGLSGELNGEVEGRGSLSDPGLSGRLDLDLAELDIGQPDKITGSAGVLFAGDKIELVDTGFDMGAGTLNTSGYLHITDPDDFWDVSLQAENLPLEYEDSTADISGDIEIAGSLFSPQITGSSRFDNMRAVLPEGETEVPRRVSTGTEDFNPRVDMTVSVGENNYVHHENAEIKIEEGNLRVIYRDRLTIDGRLTSRQGWAFFYNNRFTLESARLEFSSSRGVVPRVNVRATTRTQNTTITVNIDGSPDNITTSFTSEPEMSEQEILGLLTRRGGVSGFIRGENRSLPGLFFQEGRRFLSDTLQLQILGWQRTLREQLKLDRLEIITHDLGWDEEISLYIGKDLTDRLYIETQSEFGSGNHRTDLIFSYDLTEYTSLGGTLLDINPDGWEDYSITIETGIEF